jgi:hypothetical protein
VATDRFGSAPVLAVGAAMVLAAGLALRTLDGSRG